MSEKTKEEIIELIENDAEFRKKIEDKIEDEGDDSEVEGEKSLSRRDFLRKAGLGAAGLGAASMLPSAAGLNIRSDNSLSFSGKSGGSDFSVDPSGTLKINQIGSNSEPVSNIYSNSVDVEKAKVDEALFSGSDGRAGALMIDDNGGYRAICFVTEEQWTDSSDAGKVLQSLYDALNEAVSDSFMGSIEVGGGTFRFSTPVVINYGKGSTLCGQSFKQGQDNTEFRADGMPEGRGIVELGTVGRADQGNEGRATHLRNLQFNLADENVVGVYNWASDRCRLTDLSAGNPGKYGMGICYIGTYNTTWNSVYGIQAGILGNGVRGKNTNSFRMRDCTFNSNHSNAPPISFLGGGTIISDCLFNSHDGASLNDGVRIMDDDSANVPIINVDSRVSESDIAASVKRTRFSNCQWVGPDVSFGSPRSCLFTGCTINGGPKPIILSSGNRFVGCQFNSSSGNMLAFDSDGGAGDSNLISGCYFRRSSSASEAAIKFIRNGNGDFGNISVNANLFTGGDGNSPDMEVEGMGSNGGVASNFYITNNVTPSGITESGWVGYHNTGRGPVKIVNNLGYNDTVFDSRGTPSLPSGTGSSNKVVNEWPQPATIYQSGMSGINIVDRAGNEKQIPVDIEKVTVPAFGAIYYISSVPSEWEWYWN